MPLRGQIWDYFNIVDAHAKKAECNYCKKTISYKSTASNLKRHLQHKHLIIFEEVCRNNNINKNSKFIMIIIF